MNYAFQLVGRALWVFGLRKHASDLFIRGYAISLAKDWITGIGGCLPALPGFFKFLLFDGLVKASDYWTPPIVAGIDGLAYNASALIMVLNTKKAIQVERVALATVS